MNAAMYDKLSSAIAALEDRLKAICLDTPTYSNSEQNHFSETWLTRTWQVNIDIGRIRKLMHEYKYNPNVVSKNEVNRLREWLLKKYELDIVA